MATTWGILEINDTEYKIPDIKHFGDESDVIPNIGISGHQTFLQMLGRGRERRELSCWATKVDFDSLQYDYETFVTREVIFNDGSEFHIALIEKLNGKRMKGSTIVFYDITFLEVQR